MHRIVGTYDGYALVPYIKLSEIGLCLKVRCDGMGSGRSEADIEAFTCVLLIIAVDGSSAHLSSEGR